MKQIKLFSSLALSCMLQVSFAESDTPHSHIYDEYALSRTETTRIMTNAAYRPNYFMSVAHRAKISGYSELPENSLSAIKNSIETGGIDLLEIDLKISSDGVVYLMHDDYLQRTTNFTDLYKGTGTGKDNYGKCSAYTWNQVKNLLLKRSDFSCSTEKIPLFRDVLSYIKNTQAILNLDINSDEVFDATWKIVKAAKAFDLVIFKTRGMSLKDFKAKYYDNLTQEERQKLILFPILSAKIPDIINYYKEWENSGIPKGYEVSFRGNKTIEDEKLLKIALYIRLADRVRVHAFSTMPDNYKGRYRGNVNKGQCCNDAFDRRGDWAFLLDPNQDSQMNDGVNGSIITDDPVLLNDFYTSINRHN